VLLRIITKPVFAVFEFDILIDFQIAPYFARLFGVSILSERVDVRHPNARAALAEELTAFSLVGVLVEFRVRVPCVELVSVELHVFFHVLPVVAGKQRGFELFRLQH